MLSSRAIVLTACISLASLHESQGFSQVTAGNLALKGLRRPSSSISRFSQRTFGKALALRAQEAGPLDNDTTATAVGAGGLVFSLIMLYSEYTLKTTGCGVPAGPAGLYGAAEGISYLYVLGLVGYSLYTKVKTGKGLPAGELDFWPVLSTKWGDPQGLRVIRTFGTHSLSFTLSLTYNHCHSLAL